VKRLSADDYSGAGAATGENVMRQLHIGDRVMFRDRAYLVLGMSPMGVMPCRVELEDEESGKLLEADADELEEGESRRPATRGQHDNDCVDLNLDTVVERERVRVLLPVVRRRRLDRRVVLRYRDPARRQGCVRLSCYSAAACAMSMVAFSTEIVSVLTTRS
jgi:hypothetical protein